MRRSQLLPLQALLLTTKANIESRRSTQFQRKSQVCSPPSNVPPAPPAATPSTPAPVTAPQTVETLIQSITPLLMAQPHEERRPLDITETDPTSATTPVPLKNEEEKVSVTTRMRSINSPNVTKLTPEIYLDDEDRAYLIRFNGEIITVVNCLADAITAVDSLAEDEVKKLEEPYVKGLRRTMNEGTQVQLFTQTKGWMGNGPLVRVAIIDILIVTKPCLLKPREIGTKA